MIIIIHPPNIYYLTCAKHSVRNPNRIGIRGKSKYFVSSNSIRSFSVYMDDYEIQMFSLTFLKTLKNTWPGIPLYLILLLTHVVLFQKMFVFTIFILPAIVNRSMSSQ